MRKFTKMPLSIADQITHLSHHNIAIENKSLSYHFLNTIGYYRLSAY